MNFANVPLEKPADELRQSSGADQAWTGDVDVDFDEQSVDAVAGHVLFSGNLVAGTENAFGFLEIHDDGTRVETADGSVDDLPDFVGEFIADNLFFRFADLLQNCLFCRLGGDASEILGCDFPADFFTELSFGHAFAGRLQKDLVVVRIFGDDFEKRPCADVPGFPVDFHLELIGRVNAFSGRGKQRFFDRVDELILAYSPLLFDIFKNGQKFVIHCRFLHPAD